MRSRVYFRQVSRCPRWPLQEQRHRPSWGHVRPSECLRPGSSSRSSLLLSPVFICSYMFLAPVFGYLGDRYNRKLIMSVGIAFWSAVTLASSYTPRSVSGQPAAPVFTQARLG